MFKYSTIAAALFLVGSVAAASAAVQLNKAGVTQIDQYGNYHVSHAKGAIPTEPGNAAPAVWRR